MNMPAFTPTRRGRRLISGAWVEVTTALAVTLAMLVLRAAFSLASVPELIGDRMASLPPVELFLSLLTLAGGSTNLKTLGVVGVLLGRPHFHGLPPGQARWSAALTLLGLCLVCVPFLLACRTLVEGAPGAGPLSEASRLPAVVQVAA